jgi:hypothetical protein
MMAVADKNFRLSKTVKRLMCTIVDKVERNSFKKAMVAVEYTAAVIKNTRGKDKDSKRD